MASYQIILLQLSGDVNPNPGPKDIEQHNSTEQQRSTRLLTFYANARSIVNKSSKLDLTIAALGYDMIVLTETHLDSSIPDYEIFPSNYSVFRRDRKLNGRHHTVYLLLQNHQPAMKNCARVRSLSFQVSELSRTIGTVSARRLDSKKKSLKS